MFRKKQDVAERSRSLLKSSAARKLKVDILEQLPSLSKDVLDELMPTKEGIEMVKLATRALVYLHVPSKTPLFFDSDGRNKLFPTVYALWRVRQILAGGGELTTAAAVEGSARSAACCGACPTLVVHPPVSKFVLNGADVMLPGVVCRDIAAVDYVMGERRCIRSSGNPDPYAVGEMLKDREGVLYGGMTGKGLKVLHCYLDFLWQMGPQTLPNEGFRPEGVLRLPSEDDSVAYNTAPDAEPVNDWEELTEAATRKDEAPGARVVEDTVTVSERELGLGGISLEDTHEGKGAAAGAESRGSVGGAVGIAAEGAREVDEGDDQDDQEEEEEPMEVVDERLLHAFLNGLKKVLKDAQLPMLVSTFYSSVLLPSRPPGTSINVKRTRYRKISNFLKEMEDRGIVTLQVDKGVQSLAAVNRSHPELRTFRGTSITAASQAAEEVARNAAANEERSGARAASGAASGADNGGSSMRAFELYKLSHNIKKMLGSNAASTTGKYGEYLTPAEARNVLFAYIKSEGLEHPTNKARVTLNGPLCDNLYKPTNKKAPRVEYPTEATKAELPRRFLERLQLHHAIVLPGSTYPYIGRGGIPTVSIEVEKRQGNRHATKVRGLEAYGIDPAVLGRQVQKRYACSTSSQPAPGTNGKYLELMLQGHLANELEDLLSGEMGIPRQFLTTGFSKGAKPRRAR